MPPRGQSKDHPQCLDHWRVTSWENKIISTFFLNTGVGGVTNDPNKTLPGLYLVLCQSNERAPICFCPYSFPFPSLPLCLVHLTLEEDCAAMDTFFG